MSSTITYKITVNSKQVIEKLPWIKANFELGGPGSRDNREITRLLENTHYPHIMRTLEQIDKYGAQSCEIGKSILTCKDQLGLSRLIAEMNLFVYLFEQFGSSVIPIEREPREKTPDFSIILDKYKCLIELYSPMDFYGYQSFKSLLKSCIKNLPINKGFDVVIRSSSETNWYTNHFPGFRDIFNWINEFNINFIKWLDAAKAGNIYRTNSPGLELQLEIELIKLVTNPDDRSIIWSGSTKSSDTILYFRIDDPN